MLVISLLAGIPYESLALQNITICELTGPGRLSCSIGKEIQITSVLYGRTNALSVDTCNTYKIPITNFSCVGGNQSTNFVINQCSGKSSCTLTNSYTILGDPCPNVPKFLKVDYDCITPTMAPTPNAATIASVTPTMPIATTTSMRATTTAILTSSMSTFKTTTLSPAQNQSTICEQKSETFTCPPGKVLYITHVLWGRMPPSPPSLCNPFNTNVTGANCKGGPTATNYVTGLCNGKSTCLVTNDWTQLGPDPCTGIPKYLQVSFQCSLPTTTSITTGLATTVNTAIASTKPVATTMTASATTNLFTTLSTTMSTPTTTPVITPSTTPGVTLPSTQRTATVCAGRSETLRCKPAGFEIFVDNVFYGRNNNVTCGMNNSTLSSINCHGTNNSERIVRSVCDTQSSCIVNSNPSWLGEKNCLVGQAYLQVTYHCVPLPLPSTQKITLPTVTSPSASTITSTSPATATTRSTTITTTQPTTHISSTTTKATTPTTTPTTITTTTTTTTTTTPTQTTTPTITTTTPTTTTTIATTTTPTTSTSTSTTTSTTTATTTTTSTTSTTPTATTTISTTATTPTTPTTTPQTASTTTFPTTPMTTLPPYIPFQAPANVPAGAQVCHEYLVSGAHGVPDSNLKASSSWNSHLSNDNNGPDRSRLFTTAYDYGNGTFYRGAWTAGINDKNQYIQVELMRPSLVRGVVTQGRHLDPLTLCCVQRITEYKVSWSLDGIHWNMVQDNYGNDMMFKGNVDEDSLETHMMSCPFIARFIRLHPQDWVNHIALRFDLIGCQAITSDIGKCDPGWIEMPGTDRCYLFSKASDIQSWNDAKRSCMLQQGQLVELETVQERDFILQEISNYPVSMWWIGLTNTPRTDTKDYKWLDGHDLNNNVIQWKKGQPDNGGYGEHCGEFWNKELNDDNCDNKRNYICEKDKYWKTPLNTPTLIVKTPPTAPSTTPTTNGVTTPSTTAKPPPTVFIPLPAMMGVSTVKIGGNVFITGCISDCTGKPEGDYQSCQGCSLYTTCAVSGFFYHRPCPVNLKWDDNKKTCEYRSSSCRGP